MNKNVRKERLKCNNLSPDALEFINGGANTNDLNEEEYQTYMTIMKAISTARPDSPEREAAWNELNEFWDKMDLKYG